MPFPCCRIIPHGRPATAGHDVRLQLHQHEPLADVREVLLAQVPLELPDEREVHLQVHREVGSARKSVVGGSTRGRQRHLVAKSGTRWRNVCVQTWLPRALIKLHTESFL